MYNTYKKNLVTSAICFTVMSASATANIIIEDLYITNPDGTTVTGADWDKVEFQFDDSDVSLLGVLGDNGNNYVYLDVPSDYQTRNPKPQVTVTYGNATRTVYASWSLAMHMTSVLAVPSSFSDYSILGNKASLPSYDDNGTVYLCPLTPVNKAQSFDSSDLIRPYIYYKTPDLLDGLMSRETFGSSSVSKALYNEYIDYATKVVSPYVVTGTSSYIPVSAPWSLSSMQILKDQFDNISPAGSTPIQVVNMKGAAITPITRAEADTGIQIPEYSTMSDRGCYTPDASSYKGDAMYGTPPLDPALAIPVVF